MTSWQVEVITAPGQELNDDQLGRLTEELPGGALTYNDETRTIAVRFLIDTRTQAQAVTAASKAVTSAARRVLGETVSFVGIRVGRGDKDPAPAAPELVGYIEIAAILAAVKAEKGEGSLSRQRARQIAEDHPDFPAPVVRLAVGPIFTLDSVLEFAKNWAPKTGRPRISG